jgi:hypothetical protein
MNRLLDTGAGAYRRERVLGQESTNWLYASELGLPVTFYCSGGGIGRRARLRIWWSNNPCGFESLPEHQSLILQLLGRAGFEPAKA